MGNPIGSVDSSFTYRLLIFAVALTILTPMVMSQFRSVDTSALDDMESDYYQMTGSEPVSEEIWALTGIYTPYSAGETYGYTEDGWLYKTRVGGTYMGDDPSEKERLAESGGAYAPSQYSYGLQERSYYSVAYDGHVYRYTGSDKDGDPLPPTVIDEEKGTVLPGRTEDGHQRGDVYTMVTMDFGQKSSIFFADGLRTDTEDGRFYYRYEGYRYAFTPLHDTVTTDADGNDVYIKSQQTTMSLIWYSVYGTEGLSGQLVLNSSDGGIAYLTAAQIISAFNPTINTAKFTLTFNGTDINCYIRINPTYTSMGYSISDCFYSGYWSVMITSLSTDANDMLATDYSLNVSALWQTVIDLLTFRYSDYGISGELGVVASVLMTVPLYIGLIVVGMNYLPVLVITAAVGAFQSVATVLSHWPF